MLTSPFEARSYAFHPWTDARNVIGGKVVDPSGTDVLPIVNARHGKPMAHVRMSTAADVDAAVQAAAIAQKAWGEWPMRERAQVLYRARELMVRDMEELAWLVSHENGKILSEARAEIEKGIECTEFGCSLPNLAAGQQLEVSRGVRCELVDAPLGVVAGVTPFNFPFMVPLWMLPQALVGGNAFILKPSERVPLSSMKIADLFREAGLPDGILSLVQGGREVVEALCDHPGIQALAFVGSTKVAKAVYGRACSNGKRALCLGGAKNHLIVVPDADVDVAVENIVASYTGCAGQRCMAASVVLAVGDVDHIIDEVKRRSQKIVLGRDLGPVTTAGARDKIEGYVADAQKRGAKLILDGRGQSGGDDGGYWVGPTLLDGVSPDMPAGCEEIFGPVLSIIRVANLEEALAIENGNPYGNAAAVYTTSGEVARRVMGRAQAGMCGVNVGVPVPREPFGFGGWNDSAFGHGNLTGWDGYRFWTRQRKITTKWARQSDTNWMS